MAVVIRMKRGGRTHAPYYRMVVVDSRTRNRGREIEQIGIYHPAARPNPVAEVDGKKALAWLYKGAGCSDTVRTILSGKGVLKAYAQGVKPEDMPDETKATAIDAAAPAADACTRGSLARA